MSLAHRGAGVALGVVATVFVFGFSQYHLQQSSSVETKAAAGRAERKELVASFVQTVWSSKHSGSMDGDKAEGDMDEKAATSLARA